MFTCPWTTGPGEKAGSEALDGLRAPACHESLPLVALRMFQAKPSSPRKPSSRGKGFAYAARPDVVEAGSGHLLAPAWGAPTPAVSNKLWALEPLNG